jgi:hypothetical protein
MSSLPCSRGGKFEFPEIISPRKKKCSDEIKGEIQRKIHTMTSEMQL